MSVLERRVGEIRPTQLIHSFGVGAIIELPHFSAILMGLDDWPLAHCRPIVEERLLDAVQRAVGGQVEKLVVPPFSDNDRSFVAASDTVTGLPVATFPRYLRCPFCRLLAPVERFRIKTTPGRADKARWAHMNCQKAKEPSVLPARFLFAGTLGGLVRMGKPSELGRHIARALEEMRLCSSDPLCADHQPDPEGNTLHAAACHACLFAPETSCERGNKYLDRTALVTTVGGEPGFFDERPAS